jgi:PhnB protein
MANQFNSFIIPTLSVSNGLAAIDFYQEAFGANVLSSFTDNGHTVGELEVQGAKFVVADQSPDHGNYSPDNLDGKISVRIGLMVADPDVLAERAIAAGIKVVYPVADQHYGYRLGHFIDPFGHHWEIGKPL